ncbi:MAG: MBL fold metallo-hydrolase, partial [Bacteroidetes bacterium]|nr:MBL fold metallo-hydrolase [Bacteroidota bacterium]
QPKIVVPIHWDNFFKPLSPHLKALPTVVDNVKLGFDYIIERTKQDGIQFRIMQGGDSVLLF